MQSHQKEIVKDITSGFQLESELQISQAQHGVAVLDIYNAEWGNAKVLNEAFRRLHTDAGDLVHLRFFSVECNSVLESLKLPQEAKAVQRPKTAINYEADTLSTFWSPILEKRCQHSKPFFVFFKEGKMRDTIEGIDTPKICKYIQDLCKQQNLISEYVTNANLLRFWQKYFSPYESEVNWSSFVAALKKEGCPTDDATMSALAAATNAEAKVDVASVQSWLGESATLQEKIAELQGGDAARELPAEQEGEEEKTAQEGAHEEKEEPTPVHAAAPAEEEKEAKESDDAPKDGDEWREMDDEEANADAPVEEHSNVEEVPAVEAREIGEEAEQAAEAAAEPKEAEEPQGGDEMREIGDEEADAEAPAHEEQEDKEETPPEEFHEIEEEPHAADAEDAPEEPKENDDAAQNGDEWREMDDEEANADAPAAEEQEEREDAPVEESGEVEEEPQEAEEPQGGDEWREMDEEETNKEAGAEHSNAEGAAEGVAQTGDEHRELGEGEEHHVTRTEYVTETKEVNQIYINGWVTVSEEEMHVWNGISEIPLHYPVRTAPMLRPRDEVTEAEVEVPSAETLDTLAQYMEKQGVQPASINMVCLAADQKIGSESLSYGKAALVLVSGDSENLNELFPTLGSLHSDLADGVLLQKDAPVAGTTMCLCASEVYADEAFYYTLKEDEEDQFAACTVDQELVLSALTPLFSRRPGGDSHKVRIAGIPKVIELASTDEGEDTVVLSQWHAVLKVTERSDDTLSLQFVEYVSADAFQEFVAAYTERLMQDENSLERKKGSVNDDAEGEEVIDQDADEM